MTTTDPAFTAQRDQLLAELDAEDAPMPPCPEWCRLRPGHGWDSVYDDGKKGRGHAGPHFGAHVSICSREHQDGHVDEFGIDIAQETTEDDVLTADQARELASHVIAAAEWLEAHS